MGMGDLNTKRNALTAKIALCHFADLLTLQNQLLMQANILY
jgi:hypothetical protein